MSNFNTYNNNQSMNKQASNDITMYSGYRMNNAESKLDATCFTQRYWKSNLCLGIFPRKNTNNDEVTFDMDNGITIYLSHSKARILKNEIELFLSDPTKYNGVGVSSGQATITISNGLEYGKNTPVITIRKIDTDGRVVSSFVYEFKTDYYFAIRNYDGVNYTTNYEDYKYIEIHQLLTVLDEYIKAATNATAFSIMNQRSYSFNKLNASVEAIAASLGVNTTPASTNTRRSSYFANNPRSENNPTSNFSNQYTEGTMDDLE